MAIRAVLRPSCAFPPPQKFRRPDGELLERLFLTVSGPLALREIASLTQDSAPQPALSLEQFLLRSRILLTWIVAIGLIGRLLLLRHWEQRQPHDPINWHDHIAVIGDVLIALGLSFRSWACSVIRKRKELAQHGPYSMCRHPLYFGSALMMAGFCVLFDDWFTTAIFAMSMTLIYRATIAGEERWLSEAFLDSWPSYVRTVPCFLPLRFKGPFGPVSFQSWRSNREYRTVLSVILGLVIVWGLRQ